MKSVHSIIAAVVVRQRIADAAWGLARIALPAGLFIAALMLVATRRFDVPPQALWLTAVPVPLVLGWALLRRHPWRAVARRIDAHYGTGDELGNAIELSSGARRDTGDKARADAIVTLLCERAEARAKTLDPRPVVPLSVPGPRWLDLVGLAAVGGAMLVPPPEPPAVFVDPEPIIIEPPPKPPKLQGPDLAHAEPLRDDLKELAAKDEEDVAAKIAAEMLDVLDKLEQGEIDRAQAFEELERLEELLAEAEDRFEASLEEDPGLLGEAMRDLADALEQHELTEEAAKALDEGKGDDAEKALNDAAEQALGEQAQRNAAEEMEKAMAEAEKALAKTGADSRGTEREIAEKERRLEREKKREPQTKEDKEEHERRLKKMRDELEQLKRRQEREQAARDKIEKLRRNAKDAANRSSSAQQRKDAVQKLSRGVNKASQTSKQSRRLGQARDSMQEAKSVVRRAGQQGEGQQRRRQQMRRFSQAAKGDRGKDGKGQGKDGKTGQGKDGKGKDGKGKSTLLIEGKVGEGDPNMIMEMPGEGQGQGQQGEGQGQGEGEGEGEGQGQGQGDQPGSSSSESPGGDGMGEGSVEPMMDDPTGMKTNTKNVRVNAKHGRGATRAEVIRDASQDGFANETYKNVYEDYRSFAQSAIDNEALPAAQRRRVKRYYQLIQPRQ